jgi:hypothetical protein
MSAWGLAHHLRWIASIDDDELELIDTVIAERLSSMSEANEFCHYTEALKKCPKSSAKINQVVLNYLCQPEASYDYNIDCLSVLFSDAVKDKVVELFISGQFSISFRAHELLRFNGPNCLTLLARFIDKYKNSSIHWHKSVCAAFQCVGPEDFDSACKLLSECSPNLQAILLTRPDISEQYMLIGLRALTKLKNPKTVRAKIKYDSLKKLGPKGRLEVVKHLIGFSKNWRNRNWYMQLPPVEFEITPTKEQFSELLYSCSMLYNDQVVETVSYYDFYLERLESNKGENK